ncbi:hypothetical protein pipiens_012009 [Culex pipiens pipiens]|uniref:Chitin-binding type-2 domain-containing protein n=1 Tax=Culex pipiens pipiens TaxID=38569 RepID=A0ABD1D425_CULPP
MKTPTVLSLTVLFVAARANSLAAVADQEIVQGMLRAAFTDPFLEKACDGTRQAACTGCDSIKICTTSDPAFEDTNPRAECPAATPHCSMSTSVTGAVCQKTPDASIAECAAGNANFKCTGVGFYPNPYSCQIYHYCSGPGAVPENYDCPTGYRFSSKAGACALSNIPCPTFSCKADNVDTLYQTLPADTQYYVYCAYDRAVTPAKLMDTFVFSCGQGATFSPTAGKCVFTCPKDGLFVNSANPTQYYQCYLMNYRYVYKDLVCAVDQKFDEAQRRCIQVPPV